MLTKLLTSFLTGLIVLFSLAPYSPALAQIQYPPPTSPASSNNTASTPAPTDNGANTWYLQNPFEWYLKVYDEKTSPANEIFGERYTAAQVEWIVYSLLSYGFNLPYVLIGMNPSPNIFLAGLFTGTVNVEAFFDILPDFLEAIINKFKSFNVQVLDQTPDNVGSIWQKIFFEDRPFSGITYLRNLGKKLNLVSEAHAAPQPFGFNRLSIISDLWKITRNIAFFFFVLAAIITAFFIMFRVKISPQAVVTIQSAIPKVIISMLLVTFSFAIAGFLVDLVYVLMGLASLLLSSDFFGTAPSIFKAMNGLLGINSAGISVFLYSLMYLCIFLVAVWIASVGALINLNVTSLLFGWVLMIYSILLFFILIINFFKIIFALFKALAGFYLAVIIGPLQLMAGALPTSRNALGNWLKSIISKLIVFPATGLLFLIAIGLLRKAISISLSMWPNLTGDVLSTVINLTATMFEYAGFKNLPRIVFDPTTAWSPPMLGESASVSAIAFILMSLSCVMIIPKVSKAIESALAGKPFDYETAISEPVGQIRDIGGFAAGYKEGVQKGVYPRTIFGKKGIDLESFADKLKWLSFIPRPR